MKNRAGWYAVYMQHGILHGVWDYFVDKERFRYRFLEKAGCIHIFTAPERVSGNRAGKLQIKAYTRQERKYCVRYDTALRAGFYFL